MWKSEKIEMDLFGEYVGSIMCPKCGSHDWAMQSYNSDERHFECWVCGLECNGNRKDGAK